MKKINIVVAIVLLFCFGCSEKPGAETTAKNALASFKENSYEKYAKEVLLKAEDWKKIHDYALDNNGEKIPGDIKNLTEEKMQEMEDGMLMRCSKQWKEFRRYGIEDGINWDEAEFVSKELEGEPDSLFKGSKVAKVNMAVNFSSKNNFYSLGLQECISMPDGEWKCMCPTGITKSSSSGKSE
ncbi:MAG: hypothetical protein D6B27_00250 [Gammaproteobacteria bacterium]|nr:MAG: hypothetical protein D6B27_00250 [Gammaproteobacteria bacterium]